MCGHDEAKEFGEAAAGLRDGAFSRLEPLFIPAEEAGGVSRIVRYHQEGRFVGEPEALAEALTCACWLGHVETAEYLLRQGVTPLGGAATGMDALHWAANRGQLAAVRLLLERGAGLETINRFGGTVIDLVLWSAVHEPKPDHAAVLDALWEAGARPTVEVELTGRADVDEVIRRRYQRSC